MVDNMSSADRSWTMSRIRSKHNGSTELRLLQLFKNRKISGWRRHRPLPGKPDFVFPTEKVVVFVDGCFWHGCKRCRLVPRSNVVYWRKKIARNRERDREVNSALRDRGWHIVRVKEHTLRSNPAYVLRRITMALGCARPDKHDWRGSNDTIRRRF